MIQFLSRDRHSSGDAHGECGLSTLTILHANGGGGCRSTAGMKEKFGPSSWLLHNDPLIRIVIDVKDFLGIPTSKRDRAALSIECDAKALAPGHCQLSGESEFRSDF